MEIDQELTEKSAKNTQRWWKLNATLTCLSCCIALYYNYSYYRSQQHECSGRRKLHLATPTDKLIALLHIRFRYQYLSRNNKNIK